MLLCRYLFMIFYDFPTISSLANRTRRAFRHCEILQMQFRLYLLLPH